jgi:mannose-6-phosphate isomerase-like protein (cupin superfamily)
MTVPTITRAEVFNLTTPYLEQGATTEYRARTDLLHILIKVYASGGENRMHAHTYDDHAMIVLEGEATFHLETEDNVRVLKPYEGVMLPKGVFYRFQSSGPGNLVLLRVGAAPVGTTTLHATYPEGDEKKFDLEPAGRVEPIAKPGRQFGELD